VARDPRIGTLVGGYLLQEPIGRGGMGVVYRAEDRHPGTAGRAVAIKLLAPELSADDRFRKRFEQESRMAASLDHPNIVPVFEAGEAEDGLLFIAMRLVEGDDLRTVLEREGPLAPERALGILGQVAAALDAAHARGLIHRDVKPGNILLLRDDESIPHVYLTDFGLTKRTATRSGLTRTGQFVGTLDYVAPEQIEGRDVDHRTDLYSLACVLFEVLTGTAPYGRDDETAALYGHLTEDPPRPSQRRAGIPSSLDAVVERGLAKKKEQRYASCREMIAAARAALDGHRPPAAAGPPAPPPAPATAVAATPPAPSPSGAPAAPLRTAGAPPPHPPTWGPTPHPSTAPSRNTTWIVLSIAVAVLVVAGTVTAIVLARRGGGSTDGEGEGSFPNPAESELLNQVDPTLQSPPCTRAAGLPSGARAGVDCFTDTPQLSTFILFGEPGSMTAEYDTRVAASPALVDTGDCSAGETSEGTWVGPDGAVRGRLLCYFELGGSAFIVWTHDGRTILGAAERPDGDLQELYSFWTGIADYV